MFFDLNQISIDTCDLPFVVGPKGRLHILRDIKNLRIVPAGMAAKYTSELDCYELQDGLKRLVTELTKDVDAKNRKSRLKNLTICTEYENYRFGEDDKGKEEYVLRAEKSMFALEPLVHLRPALNVREVTVMGIPTWFASCLEMYIRGDGGHVNKVDWPTRPMEIRNKNQQLKREAFVSLRTWHQPVYDWREFANRNGIELPEDVGRFWQVKEWDASLLYWQ